MSLVKFEKNGRVVGQFPNLIDEFFGNDLFNRVAPKSNIPAVNIKEDENQFEIFLAVPGMKREDFDISVKESVLTVSTKLSEDKKEEKSTFTRREYSFSEFTRAFNLPESINVSGIKAKCEHGELSIIVPKSAPVEPEKIQVTIE